MRYSIKLAVAILLWMAWPAGSLSAQPAAAPPSPVLPPTVMEPADSGGADSQSVVQRTEPDTFLLPDGNGQLQKVLQYAYEDFLEAIRLKGEMNRGSATPRYSMQRLDITGAVHGDRAELTIVMEVLLNTTGTVGIPIGMRRVAPKQPLDAPDAFIDYDDDSASYLLWMRGEAGQSRTLSWTVLAPVKRVAGESVLQLNLPRAVASELRLNVDLTGAEARVSDEAALVESNPKGDDNSTELVAHGIGGEFEIGWSRPNEPAPRARLRLEAKGEILCRIDGGGVHTEADLTVRSFGGPFDHLQVRLPPGAELVSDGERDYAIAPSSTSEDGGIVDVRLDSATAGPVTIRLVTEQPHRSATPEQPLELAGFEVLGAVSQYGHIAVERVGNWHVLWQQRRGAYQVETLPESLRSEDLAAGFEYFRQPFSLTARLAPRERTVRVEPQYVLLIGEEQARLEARLRYTVRGNKAFQVEIEMAGWEVDAETIGPANLVDIDAIPPADGDRLTVPLLQPSIGQIDLTFSARRAVDRDDSTARLPLPRPVADSQTRSIVVVLPDDNVELIPQTEAMVGLSPQQSAPRIELPPRQQNPLYFLGDVEAAEFAARVRVYEQAINVDAQSDVTINPTGGRVAQTFTYRVAYEPVDKLSLEVPPELAAAGGLEISIDGEPLLPVTVRENTEANSDSEHTLVQITLKEPRIGAFTVNVSYAFGGPLLRPEQSTRLPAPLVMPADGTLGSNGVTILPAEGTEVTTSATDWAEVNPSATATTRRRELRLSKASRALHVPLVAHLIQPRSEGSTVVQRAWLQSWLTATARQDRATFRFTTNEPSFEVLLPEGVAEDAIEAKLDSERLALMPQQRRLTVPLPESPTQREYLLELRYHMQGGGASNGPLVLEPSRPADDIWIRHIYWQVVLPNDLHVVVMPADFAREFLWDWRGLYWGRQPLMEQSQLETWVGAQRGTSVPSTTNRYLFSSLKNVQPLRISTADRSLIVLLASAVTLGMGLLLLYVRASRHPGVLLAGALALMALGLVYPEPAMLIAQAATLGLLLAVLATLLKLVLTRQRQAPVVVRGSASSMASPIQSTESLAPPVAEHPPGSTATLQPSESNS
ncbi:MAG: hypothetical protein WDZ59_09430 [Pirellulales bacterium]